MGVCVRMDQVWLQQRGHNGLTDSLGGFALAMFVMDVYRRGLITATMSSYQVFRIVMEQLATVDFTSGVYLSQTESFEAKEVRAFLLTWATVCVWMRSTDIRLLWVVCVWAVVGLGTVHRLFPGGVCGWHASCQLAGSHDRRLPRRRTPHCPHL